MIKIVTHIMLAVLAAINMYMWQQNVNAALFVFIALLALEPK